MGDLESDTFGRGRSWRERQEERARLQREEQEHDFSHKLPRPELRGLKEDELRKLATCAGCRRKIGDTEAIFFYVITVERYGLDFQAISRQSGLEQLLTGCAFVAQALGPNEDLAKAIMEPKKVMVCERCSQERPLMHIALGDE